MNGQYLGNVTAATIEWYKNSFKWLPTPTPSQADLRNAVIRRAKGLKISGCNSVIQALNSYSHWAHAGSDSKCGIFATNSFTARLFTSESGISPICWLMYLR